ncbi:MAG: hypothetical protein RIS94_585 [Pseudomonadota bacterium]|jgi:hypothetical protein
MYSLLFRSRWAALLWVGLVAAYALFMTSGPSLLGLVAPPPVSAEDTRQEKRARDEAKFRAWAAQDTRSSESRDNANEEYGAAPDGYNGQ